MNLESALQEFATALEHEREGLWEASWAVHRASQVCDQEERPAPRVAGVSPRRALFGSFAMVGACTITRVRQLCMVGAAFPTPENVRQDKSHTWHRAVAQRAHALGMDVEELAELAIQEGWGQREIAAYGKPADALVTVGLRAQCGECGAVVRVRMRGLAIHEGRPVPCPVCCSIQFSAGRIDESEWPAVGRLEIE